MIKTKLVTIPAIPAKQIEVKETYCDVCNRKVEHARTCVLCERVICHPNIKRKEGYCSYFDEHELGDYPDVYCKYCFRLKFETYKDRYAEIDEVYYKQLEELNNQVKEDSLEV